MFFKIKKILKKGIVSRFFKASLFTLLDQGLFSSTNFIISIILARLLIPSAYGAFTLSLTIFYLLAAIHTAILTEPMTVYGAGKYKQNINDYLSIIFDSHCVLSILISIILIIFSYFLYYDNIILSDSFFGLGISTPFLLSLWFMRRVCYIFLNPKLSAFAMLLNFCIIFAALYFIYLYGNITIRNTFYCLALGSTLSTIFLMIRTQISFKLHISLSELREIFFDHLSYGKWNILNLLTKWLSSNSVLILIPSVLGLSANAIFAANWNIFRPISLLIQSASIFFLPTFSSWFANDCSKKQIISRVKWIVVLFGVFVLIYTIIVSLFSKPIFYVLYKDLYVADVFFLFALGLTLALSSCISIIVIALKAVGSVHLVNRLWFMSLIATILIFYPAFKMLELNGAVLTLMFSYMITLYQAILFLKKS